MPRTLVRRPQDVEFNTLHFVLSHAVQEISRPAGAVDP